MDPKERPQGIRLAIWIRRVQRERIKHSGGHQVHRNARQTPPEAIISGGICGVSEEKQGRVRRTLHLELIVFRPYRACFRAFERTPRACALGCILAPLRG
jgi:hypothetical protein